MIELFSRDDYKSKIADTQICKYLENNFNRYPDDFKFGAESSFIILDNANELNKSIKLANNNIIPSIYDTNFSDMITMIDGDENVVDIILLFSDFGDGVSIIIKKEQLSTELFDILHTKDYTN